MNLTNFSNIFSKAAVEDPILAPHGESVYELIGRSLDHGGAAGHSLAHIVIAPGKASQNHYHNLCEESYYLLTGRARMVVNDREFPLSPGQACLILPGQRHQIFNTGAGDLEFLAICVPAWYPEDSYFE